MTEFLGVTEKSAVNMEYAPSLLLSRQMLCSLRVLCVIFNTKERLTKSLSRELLDQLFRHQYGTFDSQFPKIVFASTESYNFKKKK